MSSFLYHHRQQHMPSPLPPETRLKICAVVIPLLASLLPLKYLNMNFNPYDTHPKAIKAFIYVWIVFFVSSIAEAKLYCAVDNIYGLVCGYINELSAVLAVILLAFMVFPVPLTWFDYIAFMFVLICSFLCFLDWLRKWFYEKTRKAVEFALECLYGFPRRIFVRHQLLHNQEFSTLLPISSASISMVLCFSFSYFFEHNFVLDE